jgi:hypothetical protein
MRKIILVFLAGLLVGVIAVGVPMFLKMDALRTEMALNEEAHQKAVEKAEKQRQVAEEKLVEGLAHSFFTLAGLGLKPLDDKEIELLWEQVDEKTQKAVIEKILKRAKKVKK